MNNAIILYESVMNFCKNTILMSKTNNNQKSPVKGLKKADIKFHYKKFTSKVMHGYFFKTIEKLVRSSHLEYKRESVQYR